MSVIGPPMGPGPGVEHPLPLVSCGVGQFWSLGERSTLRIRVPPTLGERCTQGVTVYHGGERCIPRVVCRVYQAMYPRVYTRLCTPRVYTRVDTSLYIPGCIPPYIPGWIPPYMSSYTPWVYPPCCICPPLHTLGIPRLYTACGVLPGTLSPAGRVYNDETLGSEREKPMGREASQPLRTSILLGLLCLGALGPSASRRIK